MSQCNIRILLVEDHPIVRTGLQLLLARLDHLLVVGAAQDGLEALLLYRETRPDVVLMDLAMPQVDGLTSMRMILAEFPMARIIVLTSFDGEKQNSLHAGAKAFVSKSEPTEYLLQVLEQVAAADTCPAHETSTELSLQKEKVLLTEREREILQYIVDGCSNPEIGTALVISVATVKTHVNNLIIKLNARNRTEAAAIGLKRGLVTLR